MESSNPTFSVKILDYLKVAAHCAMFTTVVIAARLCFTIYYVYTYYKSFAADANIDKHAISYFSNSAMDVVLSLLSMYFLYKFAQHIYQVIKNNHSMEWEGVFAQFRNYLIIGTIVSLNWMLFSVMNLFSAW